MPLGQTPFSIFLFFYETLFRLFLFFAPWLFIFNPKLRRGFKIRSHPPKPWLQFLDGQNPLWFHCASGELEYAKPVLREIKKIYPHQKIMVTFFSPSVMASLSSMDEVDFATPLPWDQKKLFREFIDFHKPKALLIARTDLWPCMLQVCYEKKIPSLLFSKTVAMEKNFLQKTFLKKLLPLLSTVFCVTKEDGENLYKQLNSRGVKSSPEIYATGDTRYDQCLYRLKHPKKLKPLNNFNRVFFILGSSWLEDEKIIPPLMSRFQNQLSLIVAPHEPTPKHLKQLEKKIKTHSLQSSRYSQVHDWNPDHVLIIDQVGLLADLYSWGSFSFVGGSMGKQGVHSVMEPLAQGCLTFVGPNHKNNREAMDFQKENIGGLSPVQQIHSPLELVEKLEPLLEKWKEPQREELKSYLRQRSGGSEKVLQWIRNNTDL